MQTHEISAEDRGRILHWTFDQWAICLAKFDPGRIDSVSKLKGVQKSWRDAYGADPDPEPFLGHEKAKDLVRAAMLFNHWGIEMILDDQKRVAGNFEASDRVAFAKQKAAGSTPLIFLPR